MRIVFTFSYDTDYANYRRESPDKEYSVIRVNKDQIVTWDVGSQEPYGSILAERRPDGLWYTKRDWDAPGYERFEIRGDS